MGFEVYGTIFRVDSRYTFIKALGKGAYGVVCSAKDSKNNEKVAIKKICPMAKSVYDAKHTLREVRLLRHCGKHPNIITLKDLMINPARDELYISMECMDTDLHRIIQSSQKLSASHHRHFMYQLLQGIKFLHSNGVLHRDLKPANLLVSKNCDLRISDFGLARTRPDADDGKPLMTEHVVTRWYRPPELMLSPDGKYTAAVDMWSIGCIFAELVGRTPLFPGKNFVHQLQLIFDVIGTPEKQETAYIKNTQALQFLRSLSKKRGVSFATLYPQASKESVDFITEALTFNSSNRLSVSDALMQPLFDNTPYRNMKSTDIELDTAKFNFHFEQQDLNEKQLKEIIIDEVQDFRYELDNLDTMDVSSDSEQPPISSEKNNNNLREYNKQDYSRKKLKPKTRRDDSRMENQQKEKTEYARKIRSRYIRSATSSSSSSKSKKSIPYDDFDERQKLHDNNKINKSERTDENKTENQMSIASVMKKLRSRESTGSAKTERKLRSKSDAGDKGRPVSARRSKPRSSSSNSQDATSRRKEEPLSRSLFSGERKKNVGRGYTVYSNSNEEVENRRDSNSRTTVRAGYSEYEYGTKLPDVQQYSTKRYLDPQPPKHYMSPGEPILQERNKSLAHTSYVAVSNSDNSQRYVRRSSDDVYEIKKMQSRRRSSLGHSSSNSSSSRDHNLSSSSTSSISSQGKNQRRHNSSRVTIPKPFNLSYHQTAR